MKRVFAGAAALALAAAGFAQDPKQPKIKSPKEQEAVMAVFNAADSDTRIAAVENLLTKFVDTEFKAVALQVAAMAAQEKNDFEKMVIYAERTLEADPKNFHAMLMLASGFAQRTRETDLDKEEKLNRAEKFAKDAIEILKTAPKPRPDLDEAQWQGAKKDITAQGYEALGMTAMVRKKYDDAITNFKTAIEGAATQDPATRVRLASAYNQTGKFDEALAALEPVLADQNVNQVVRQFAGQEKVKAAMGKAQKK